MPGPRRSTRARPGSQERPRTPWLGAAAWLTTMLPGASGRKLLQTRTGMPRSRAGAMVLGCSTLAPKWASSMASSKLSSGRGKASGTMRGSAL